ncbi:MAG: uroporphyrinogen decarboxylase family protein [Planctomycetota bacterium]|nr:uroporphyrinogen decarboxylase family protein [Planctomycetota bacterium]
MNRVQVNVSFSRDYFRRHFEVEFGKAYFEDVRTRATTDREVQLLLGQRFGDYGLGHVDPPFTYQLGYDDTLNITLMFGGELKYASDLTWVDPGFLPISLVRDLQPPVIEETWPHTRFLEQYNEAAGIYGPQSILPPVPHGILEAATDMCGEAFLRAMATRPQEAHHLLDVLTETVIALKEFWDVKCFGQVRKGLSLGGCSTTMLSPKMVEVFLVPRYSRIADHFKEAFICNCGISDHNLKNFLAVKQARFIRAGWGSDLSQFARLAKDRHVKASLSVVRAATLPCQQFGADVTYILETLREVDEVSVLLIHAGADTPDDNVKVVFNTVHEFAARHGIELDKDQRLSHLKGT